MKPWDLIVLDWTAHALERAVERGIGLQQICHVVWFARKSPSPERRTRCRLDGRAVRAARCEGLDIAALLGLVVVLEGLVVVTVFWEGR